MLNWFYNNIENHKNYETFPLTKRNVKKFGWIPDIPDNRDIYGFWPYSAKVLESVDLRKSGFIPEVYDQGELGSCTANALAAAFSYDQAKQKLENFNPSRLFIYYNEREIENSVNTDAGASLRDGIKVLNRIGVCPEADYPYDITKYTIKPTSIAYEHAAEHVSLEYRRIQVGVANIKKALSSGYPVIFGFTVYESFMTEDVEKTGIAKIPEPGEKILGGHAALIVGYEKGNFIVRNSWGKSWGDNGYFTMPTLFFNSTYCADMWVIQSVRGQDLEFPFKCPDF